jgi:hypothetical protein
VEEAPLIRGTLKRPCAPLYERIIDMTSSGEKLWEKLHGKPPAVIPSQSLSKNLLLEAITRETPVAVITEPQIYQPTQKELTGAEKLFNAVHGKDAPLLTQHVEGRLPDELQKNIMT